MQPGSESIKRATLRHWVVTLKLKANGSRDVDREWRKKNVMAMGTADGTAGEDGRRIGPIREVNTELNTIEIFNDGPVQPLPSDLEILLKQNPVELLVLKSDVVKEVAEKEVFSFILNCHTEFLCDAMHDCFIATKEEIEKQEEEKKHTLPTSSTSSPPTTTLKARVFPYGLKTATALEVSSEKKDELEEVATKMLEHFDTRVLLFNQLKELEGQFGFNPEDANTSIGRRSGNNREPAGGIADFIKAANRKGPPSRPLTVFFVEGASDQDFAWAVMTLLYGPSSTEHLRILVSAKKSPPKLKMLSESLTLVTGVPPQQLGAVDFVVLEDSDLGLLSVNDGETKPNGIRHSFGRVHQSAATDKTPATYCHRWRFGRALENYLIPSLTPLALFGSNPDLTFDLCVEAICKISTEILYNSKKKSGTLANGFVATLEVKDSGRLIKDLILKLGFRMLDSTATLEAFKRSLHAFLCGLEAAVNPQLEAQTKSVMAFFEETTPAAAPDASTPLQEPPPLQELLKTAATLLQGWKGELGSGPHKALCRVLFQAQESYIDLMANPDTGSHENMSKQLFHCRAQKEDGSECGCRQLLLVGVVIDLDNPAQHPRTCSCCGHQAAEHDKRFKSVVPDKEFYAALCMSAALLWHSHHYLVAIRGEKCLGRGGSGANPVATLVPDDRNTLYQEHFWWLPGAEKIDEKRLREAELPLMLKHYPNVSGQFACEPVHAQALDKLCALRQRQRAELQDLLRRLHIDQSAAKKQAASPPTAGGGN